LQRATTERKALAWMIAALNKAGKSFPGFDQFVYDAPGPTREDRRKDLDRVMSMSPGIPKPKE